MVLPKKRIAIIFIIFSLRSLRLCGEKIFLCSCTGIFFFFLPIAHAKTIHLPQVCFDDICFSVELASTPTDRSRGLMFRKHLDADKGMFFIFEHEGVYPFWMKNTLIPLDIIWINKNKEVVFIHNNAQPCKKGACPSINPKKKALYVLELQGEVAEKIGLSEGDTIRTLFEER